MSADLFQTDFKTHNSLLSTSLVLHQTSLIETPNFSTEFKSKVDEV